MKRYLPSLLGVLLAMPALVHAQAENDHLKCYKITDPLSLAAVVDLDSPQFGLEAGCTVSKAKYFCVPAAKAVISAEDKKTGPITPLPVSGPDAGDRLCYKIKCPTSTIPDQSVTDQFGNRIVKKFKASYMCTPAVKGQAYCGNGVIDAGESCDGSALGTCSSFPLSGCRTDCKCELGFGGDQLGCVCDDGFLGLSLGSCQDTNVCAPATVNTLCQQMCTDLGYPLLSTGCTAGALACSIQ